MNLAERCAGLPTAWRRVVALLVAPVGALLLIALVCAPIAYVRDIQVRWRNDAIETLASAQHAPATQSALDQQIAAMRSSPLWSKFYEAPSSASAATALHADLSALLNSAQASVQSLTPIPSEEQAAFTRVGIRFAASIRLNDLQSLLTSMGNHSRYLRVERVTVTAPQTQAADENPPLAVTMDVFGYHLSDESKARGDQVLTAQVNGDR